MIFARHSAVFGAVEVEKRVSWCLSWRIDRLLEPIYVSVDSVRHGHHTKLNY